MKTFRSIIAFLLFAVASRCAPASQSLVHEDRSVPAQITLADSTLFPNPCKLITVTDANTGVTTKTTICVLTGDSGNADRYVDSISAQPELTPVSHEGDAVRANLLGPAESSSAKSRRDVVTMSNSVSTPEGPVIENCQIQLTPDSDGNYTEIQTCIVSIQADNNVAPAGPINSPTPQSSTPDATSIISPPPPSSSSPPPLPSSSASSSAISISVSVPSSTPTPSPPASASASPPSSDSSDSASSASIISSGIGAIIISTGLTSLDLPSASASSSAPAISAAADNTSSSFTMPGTKISILPVGLAVFAGLSVIALIVVGAVTYERTKYRKNFRRRQLAEQIKARTNQMSERSMV